jgi:hypothetical protein
MDMVRVETRRSVGGLDCEWEFQMEPGAPSRLVGLTVLSAKKRVKATRMLLEHQSPPHWEVSGDILTLRATNGTYRYRVGEDSADAPGCVWLERIDEESQP